MVEKQVRLLKKQVSNLDTREFDLEAWKTSTQIILERIFGSADPKIAAIENIHYDLSSWSLRDTLATSSAMDACKKSGRAVLEAAILELETLGPPEKEDNSTIAVEAILLALEEELKISELKEITSIVNSNRKDKKDALLKIFEKHDDLALRNMMVMLFSNAELKGKL